MSAVADFYAGKPRHPQLMAPIEDPEEFIVSSIYWYPSIHPTRTEVLEHLLLTNGNGYEWGGNGQIYSVFAHIQPFPHEDTIVKREREAAEYEARGEHWQWMVDHIRGDIRELTEVRADYRHRARTYGPIRTVDKMPDGPRHRMLTSWHLGWTLLGTAPVNADPKWQPYMDEVRELFAPILIEQGTLF